MKRARLEENVRQETAALLHGNVQSALAACTIWLTMAEELLAADASGQPDAPGVTASGKAVELIRKARHEVERLHQTEVPRAVYMLYPLLIGVGLRPAVDGFVANVARSRNARFPLEISASDAFVAWDRPTSDPSLIRTRLEMYRILEAVFRLLVKNAAAGTVNVRLHFDIDIDEDRLVAEVRFESGSKKTGADANRFLAAAFADFQQTTPAERFAQTGGNLEWETVAGDAVWLRALLPLTARAA